MLIKEQNNSNQSSLSIGPNGFLNSAKKCICFFIGKIIAVPSFKNVCFKQWLLNFATIFLLIWSTCSLKSSKKECFFSSSSFY